MYVLVLLLQNAMSLPPFGHPKHYPLVLRWIRPPALFPHSMSILFPPFLPSLSCSSLPLSLLLFSSPPVRWLPSSTLSSALSGCSRSCMPFQIIAAMICFVLFWSCGSREHPPNPRSILPIHGSSLPLPPELPKSLQQGFVCQPRRATKAVHGGACWHPE